jgi:uncharacterized Rossmann fold enzyme
MRRPRVVDLAESEDVSGADVVVLRAEDSQKWAVAIRDRAPNAVVVVVGGSPQAVCEGTLFPRSRIIGVDDSAAAEAVVESIVHDLDKQFDAVVRCEGERGIEGEFARVPIKVGARGIIEIYET